MANSLKLYVDTQNNKLVQSDTDASDFTLPTFFQGDVLAVELKLLEPNTTGGLTTPYDSNSRFREYEGAWELLEK